MSPVCGSWHRRDGEVCGPQAIPVAAADVLESLCDSSEAVESGPGETVPID